MSPADETPEAAGQLADFGSLVPQLRGFFAALGTGPEVDLIAGLAQKFLTGSSTESGAGTTADPFAGVYRQIEELIAAEQGSGGRKAMVATMRQWFRRGGTVEGLPPMGDLYTAYRNAKIKALLVRLAPYGAGVAAIGALIIYRQHRARG